LKDLMEDVLFIKTSSLGDVVHHMPALTEARARRPEARFAWVVEEAFAPLVALHPAASEVIPVAARAWRRSPWQAATMGCGGAATTPSLTPKDSFSNRR
jgi:heptosyltransferase-1